jgi:hypothetical protein
MNLPRNRMNATRGLILSVCLLSTVLIILPVASAGASSWTGFAGVVPGNGPAENLTGVQIYRYDSTPSNVAIGPNMCSTLLASNQPYVYQDLAIPFTYSGSTFDSYFGTIHQCEGYQWWLFYLEYNSPSGPIYYNKGSTAVTGSNEHHFYEFINNSSSSDVMAAQVDSTIWWTTPQRGALGTAVGAETTSTSQEAVTTYQGSQLNYDNDFSGWTSFDMSSSDTYNNGAENTSGYPAMCSYVVSPPGSLVANFGQNTSNMTNCT